MTQVGPEKPTLHLQLTSPLSRLVQTPVPTFPLNFSHLQSVVAIGMYSPALHTFCYWHDILNCTWLTKWNVFLLSLSTCQTDTCHRCILADICKLVAMYHSLMCTCHYYNSNLSKLVPHTELPSSWLYTYNWVLMQTGYTFHQICTVYFQYYLNHIRWTVRMVALHQKLG